MELPFLSRTNFWLAWCWHGILSFDVILRFCVLFLCLEQTVKKNTWLRTTSITFMINFLEVPFWKLLDYSYVQSSSSTITRHIGNSIWLFTVEYYTEWINIHASQSWINMHAKHTFNKILSGLFIMKQKLTKVWENYQLHNNRSLHFEEHYTNIKNRRWHFTYYCMVLFSFIRP